MDSMHPRQQEKQEEQQQEHNAEPDLDPLHILHPRLALLVTIEGAALHHDGAAGAAVLDATDRVEADNPADQVQVQVQVTEYRYGSQSTGTGHRVQVQVQVSTAPADEGVPGEGDKVAGGGAAGEHVLQLPGNSDVKVSASCL